MENSIKFIEEEGIMSIISEKKKINDNDGTIKQIMFFKDDYVIEMIIILPIFMITGKNVLQTTRILQIILIMYYEILDNLLDEYFSCKRKNYKLKHERIG